MKGAAMKKPIVLIFLVVSAVFLLSTNAIGITITDPIIVWQPDSNFDGTLSATLNLTGSGNELTAILTNTTALDSPIDYDFPSTVLATGFGLNLGYNVTSGSITGTGGQINFVDAPNKYWGWGTTNNFNTPLDGTPYSVNTTVTTLEAYVDNAFAPGGNIDGPSHGVLNGDYPDPSMFPAIEDWVRIVLQLDGTPSDWDAFLNNIASADVVVAFGSPTNPVPEPATMLLLGSGLLSIAAYGRRKKFIKK